MSLIVALFLVGFSLIAHEMGHWVVLRRLQVPVTQWWFGLGPSIFKWGRVHIGLFPIGASVVPEPTLYAKLSSRARMAVALGGPIGSALYGLSLLEAASRVSIPIGQHGLEALAMANFMIALFNMIPIPPLDGFHLLDALLEHVGRPLSTKAKDVCYRVGNGVVYGLSFFALARLFE